MKNVLLLLALGVCGSAQAFWTWTLDNDTNELGGGPALGVVNAGKTSYQTDTVNGGSATVMQFDKGDIFNPDPFLSLVNPIGPNNGGAKTNQYSILIDLKIVSGGFQSLLQTNSGGANTTDGDWFLRGDGGLGISGDYTDAGNSTLVANDQWSRLVLTIDAGATDGYRSYVDGALQNIVQSPSGWSLDGRYGLETNMFFFADEDGETRTNWWVNNIAVWDRALTESEVADLGRATADAVPEPATMTLLGLGVAALAARKSKS